MKYYIEIPEVHKALVEVDVPDGSTREQILEIAQDKFMESGSDNLEYSHTLEDYEWVVRDKNGNRINDH